MTAHPFTRKVIRRVGLPPLVSYECAHGVIGPETGDEVKRLWFAHLADMTRVDDVEDVAS